MIRFGIGRWVCFSLLFLAPYATAQSEHPVETRMRKDITYLASPELEGRGVDTKGIEKAALYIQSEFEKAGLKPGGVKGTYFQPFKMNGPAKLEGKPLVRLEGPLGQKITLKADTDFTVMGLSGTGKVSKDVVFVSYGIGAKDIGYDDYNGFDVRDKIVLALRHTPRWSNAKANFAGNQKDDVARLDKKIGWAEAAQAAGFILVNDATEVGDKLIPFTQLSQLGGGQIPAVHVRRSVIEPMIHNVFDQTLLDIEKAIDRDLLPRRGLLEGWKATIETAVKRSQIDVKNVVGVLEGKGPLANETVIVGAHYDHVGYGNLGGSLSAKDKGKIHHGADDNASGTTAVLELARRFGKMKDREGRRLVFMTFTAEELGLIGSRHYTNKEPLFPLESTVAMVNLDMVGRLNGDKLLVHGTGTAKGFDKLVDELNPKLKITKVAGGTGPSDHDSFYRKKIPVLFFFTGTHPQYHKPTDTADLINIPGMHAVTNMAEQVIARLAEMKERPEYVQVASTSPKVGGPKGPKLGIVPDYNFEKGGVRLDDVAQGGAAQKGGLKGGDIIVEIAGTPIGNLTTYMAVMGRQEQGKELEIVVDRDGKKLKLKVTPQ
jgi:hypothetical protein